MAFATSGHHQGAAFLLGFAHETVRSIVSCRNRRRATIYVSIARVEERSWGLGRCSAAALIFALAGLFPPRPCVGGVWMPGVGNAVRNGKWSETLDMSLLALHLTRTSARGGDVKTRSSVVRLVPEW